MAAGAGSDAGRGVATGGAAGFDASFAAVAFSSAMRSASFPGGSAPVWLSVVTITLIASIAAKTCVTISGVTVSV